ncbi:hypothetical protein [Agrobacterium pusense]|uniref:hypothetical protein n=1 Tax=Agrobacterium pusense TaxID=648995 RepID=UPI002FDD3E08
MDDHDANGLSFWDIKDPRSVLGQTRAVALMRSDSRASYKHFALLEFHWGWAHQKYNHTSLASVRTIHSTLLARDPLGKAPISLNHINSANLDLVKWGWLFEIDKGSGRSGSRFIPNYAIFKVAAEGHFSSFLEGDINFSVHHVGGHKGFCISVHPMGDTSVTYEVNANLFSVNLQGDKDSLTGTVLKDGPTEREIDCAPATPPLPDGLTATDAGSAQEGFEEIWKAYGHRQRKAEARAAYENIAPDSETHARMVDAAKNWHDTWAAQGKSDAPRFTLAKWLEREEYECDPPTAYKGKEKPTAKKPPKASNDNELDSPILDATEYVLDVGPFSDIGTFDATIIDTEVHVVDQFTEKVKIHLQWGGHVGTCAEHTFYYQHPEKDVQERGQAFIRSISDCLDIDELKDTDELHGRKIRCTINRRLAISYARAA